MGHTWGERRTEVVDLIPAEWRACGRCGAEWQREEPEPTGPCVPIDPDAEPSEFERALAALPVVDIGTLEERAAALRTIGVGGQGGPTSPPDDTRPARPPRVHVVHTWAVFGPSHYSDAGDVLTVEACAECPMGWRMVVRFAEQRDQFSVMAAASRVLAALDRATTATVEPALRLSGDL